MIKDGLVPVLTAGLAVGFHFAGVGPAENLPDDVGDGRRARGRHADHDRDLPQHLDARGSEQGDGFLKDAAFGQCNSDHSGL